MSSNPLHRIPFLIVCLAASVALCLPASAQAQQPQASAFLHDVDASAFPQMRAGLSVTDATGRGIRGLSATALTLSEDGKPVSALAVSEEETGVEVVFVVNTTAVFRPRDELGTTRLDFVKQALGLWAGAGGTMRAGLDDVTVLTPEGALIQHTSTPADFTQAVTAYTPAYADAPDPGFQLIQQALAVAEDATPRPGMRRVVVLFSALLPSTNEVAVADAVSHASELRVPIHTFLVGPPEVADQPGAENLIQLAAQTGGTYAYFAAPESAQPVLDLIDSVRARYLLSYRSTANASGTHTLSAAVNADGLTAATPPIEFALTVEPPAVAFVTPPAEITRQSSDPTLDAAALPPTEQALQVIVEFPDEHPRALVRSQLYVDGTLAWENKAAPLDRFIWNLSGYAASDTHRLKVIVTDELGLEGSTLERPVKVNVVMERSPLKRAEPLVRPLGILGGIVLAGVLLAALVVAFVRRPRPAPPAIPRPKPEPRGHPPAKPRKGKAYLEVVAGENELLRTIELLSKETLLGRDAAQVQIVFNDRSVSRKHAGIVEDNHGVFRIHDENSTSGTWVNLEQTPAGGAALKHGDRVNLGRVQFIFHLRAAERGRTPLPRPISTADTGPTFPPPLDWPDGQSGQAAPSEGEDTQRVLPRRSPP